MLAIFLISNYHLFAETRKFPAKLRRRSGEALISATVVIDAAKGWAAATDLDGNYVVEVPAGSYEITFSYIGKESQKISVKLDPNEVKVLNIILKEKQKLIDEVVVSGSKYEKKLSEETVSMDVVKGSTLTNENIVSLDQGMSHISGVTIADGQVNIRGGAGWSYGAGSRVQVLQDGLPILTADASDAKWSIVPMENLDRIEVIKGAASALYGSGALDGIVNVLTAYPTDEPYARVAVYSLV